jgi:Tfp pilus assembly PilM family ATPase
MDRAVFEATRPTMQQIAQEVSLCLRHHGTSFRGARPERCVLVGPASLEPRLSEIIQEATRTPTVVSNPMRGVDMTNAVGAIERRMPQPQFVSAIGAGLRAAPLKATTPTHGSDADLPASTHSGAQNNALWGDAA